MSNWPAEEKLAERMHQHRCEVCGGDLAMAECSSANLWREKAVKRIALREKRWKGKFIKGKPKAVTMVERRMEMGFKAKEVKESLEVYMKGLVDNDLTLAQVKDLYNQMSALISLNKKYKKTVCKKEEKENGG
jgi:hypothetical protein